MNTIIFSFAQRIHTKKTIIGADDELQTSLFQFHLKRYTKKKSYYLLAAREWAPAVNHFKIEVKGIPLSVFLQQENVN